MLIDYIKDDPSFFCAKIKRFLCFFYSPSSLLSLSLKMVHKRSENKLQERKDKSFSKRKKVSGHLNRLEWLLSPPVVFQIF